MKKYKKWEAALCLAVSAVFVCGCGAGGGEKERTVTDFVQRSAEWTAAGFETALGSGMQDGYGIRENSGEHGAAEALGAAGVQGNAKAQGDGRGQGTEAGGGTLYEETVYVEGLEEEYTFLFLTDVHAVVKDESAPEQEWQYMQERYPMFLREDGTASAEQFADWIEYANERGVDALLLGGDIIDAPSDAYTEWLKEQLDGLRMPYLYVPGNHDWTFPWEYMTPFGEEEYLSRLSPMMQGNPAIQSLEVGELLLIGVDNSPGQVDKEAIDKYEELLGQDKPALVMAHVPFRTETLLPRAAETWSSPVVIGGEEEGGITPRTATRTFMELTTARGTPVELVLAGHVHFYDRNVIEGEEDVLQIVGDAAYKGNAFLIRVTGASASQ